MRDGYRRERRGPSNTEDLVAPDGKSIARTNCNSMQIYAIVHSYQEEIEPRDVNSSAELDDALDAMAEEHYQLRAKWHVQFRDWLNKCVDHPGVKLLGIVAAIVAIVGFVLAVLREPST